jgi:hypothetical protein
MPIPPDAHQLAMQIMASRDPSERAAALASVVLELLTEVQALRLAVADMPEAREKYRLAYARTRVLSHNSAGVTPGEGKVLQQFLAGREGEWMKRLGASPKDVADFEAECRQVETYT